MTRRYRDILTLPLFPPTDVADSAPASAPGVHDLDEIAARSRRLMTELGVVLRGRPLEATGWEFAFDRARTRLGCCSWERGSGGKKLISISRPFSEAHGWALMEDVVRHEIAHALDVDARRTTDHGPQWKAWARRCGADTSRLYEATAEIRLPPKYVGVCPSCGDRIEYYRRPRRPGACAACCKKYSRGKYDKRFRLVVMSEGRR
jgi:hypothetical protein